MHITLNSQELRVTAKSCIVQQVSLPGTTIKPGLRHVYDSSVYHYSSMKSIRDVYLARKLSLVSPLMIPSPK